MDDWSNHINLLLEQSFGNENLTILSHRTNLLYIDINNCMYIKKSNAVKHEGGCMMV